MQSKVYRMKVALVGAVVTLAHDSSAMRNAARIGAVLGAVGMPTLAAAQGFVRGFQNLGTLGQLIVGLLVLLGLVGGLGMVLGGLWTMYNKYNNTGHDEKSWGKISLQICAGGLAMALGWVGSNVVETLGGSTSDIGRSVSTSR